MHEEGGYTELDPLSDYTRSSRSFEGWTQPGGSILRCGALCLAHRRHSDGAAALLQEGLICVAGTRLENTHPPLPCALRDTHTRKHVYYEFNAI